MPPKKAAKESIPENQEASSEAESSSAQESVEEDDRVVKIPADADVATSSGGQQSKMSTRTSIKPSRKKQSRPSSEDHEDEHASGAQSLKQMSQRMRQMEVNMAMLVDRLTNFQPAGLTSAESMERSESGSSFTESRGYTTQVDSAAEDDSDSSLPDLVAAPPLPRQHRRHPRAHTTRSSKLSATEQSLFSRFELEPPSSMPAALDVKFTLGFLRMDSAKTSARNQAETRRTLEALDSLYKYGPDAAAARLLGNLFEVQALESSSTGASKVQERLRDMRNITSDVDLSSLSTQIVESKKAASSGNSRRNAPARRRYQGNANSASSSSQQGKAQKTPFANKKGSNDSN